MADSSFNGLRIWEVRPSPPRAAAPPPAAELPESLKTLGAELGRHEPLRSGVNRDGDVLSLQWYHGLQTVRHQRQGRWMSALLEFGRHAGERLLGLGAGLGSDLVEYAAAGAEVVVACPSAQQMALVRRNFELRGLSGAFLHAGATALPLESSSIDVVSLTGELHEAADPAKVVAEIYRVLKPGGKLLAVLPARYDVDYWRPYLAFGEPREPQEPNPLLHAARRFSGAEAKQLFSRFVEARLYRRHLRRGEVPHLYRWLPLVVLERWVGRLLVFKANKPVSSAVSEQAAA
jgi:ubiquinone/menaquinone biosynthesis C-methylase UbiE